MSVTAIIVAAGRGTRAGDGLPKQWRGVAGRRVIDWTLDAFRSAPDVDAVVAVLHPEDSDRLTDPDVITVSGGATRGASVQAGLEAAPPGTTHVLIHDAARPCIPQSVIAAVLSALDTAPAAAPAVAVTDALWRGADGRVTGTEDRTGLYRAQTPQGFHLDAIRAAYAAAPDDLADDVAVARAGGLSVTIVPGDERNLKITNADDFERAARLLEGPMDIRLGNGFDVHRFGPGDHVVLCGVRVAHDRALQGHSDADVGMHAVTDAIYGGLSQGDIGRHFPPSDPHWKGAASDIFLRHAVDLARDMGFRLGNADCTLICERPKIGPHAVAMQAELARIMGVDPARVSVKATTSEKLGFTGRGEGIAALATVTLVSA